MNLTVKLTSVTYALKAKDILKSEGIKSEIKKNPNPKVKEGCSYILTVFDAPENAMKILESNSITAVESVWRK